MFRNNNPSLFYGTSQEKKEDKIEVNRGIYFLNRPPADDYDSFKPTPRSEESTLSQQFINSEEDTPCCPCVIL